MDRDRRLTGYLRGQTDNPDAPPGFELNNPWRVRICPLLFCCFTFYKLETNIFNSARSVSSRLAMRFLFVYIPRNPSGRRILRPFPKFHCMHVFRDTEQSKAASVLAHMPSSLAQSGITSKALLISALYSGSVVERCGNIRGCCCLSYNSLNNNSINSTISEA